MTSDVVAAIFLGFLQELFCARISKRAYTTAFPFPPLSVVYSYHPQPDESQPLEVIAETDRYIIVNKPAGPPSPL